MTLDQAPLGRPVLLRDFLDRRIEHQAVRLGLVEGTLVVPLERIPGGPTVLGLGNREIAVGLELARAVLVRPLVRRLVSGAERP